VPWVPWVFGSILCGLGALIALPQLGAGSKNALAFGNLMSGIGLAMVALPSLLTVRVDRKGGFLTLNYRWLLRKTVKEIPLRQIESVDVGRRSVEITERDGRVTLLRPTNNTRAKTGLYHRRQAERLREMIGVGGSNGDTDLRKALGVLTGHDERVNQQVRHLHQARADC
jgi:hypothetical protein